MKKRIVFIITASLFLAIGCKKDDFDLNDPDVEIFVNQLKSGKYDKYEKGNEILIVRDFYKDWWNHFKDKDWKNKNPLEGTSYRWF